MRFGSSSRLRAADEASDARDARVGRRVKAQLASLFGVVTVVVELREPRLRVDVHAPELPEAERTSIAPDAQLPEESGPRRIEPDGDRDPQQDGADQRESDRRQDTVEDVLAALAGPRVVADALPAGPQVGGKRTKAALGDVVEGALQVAHEFLARGLVARVRRGRPAARSESAAHATSRSASAFQPTAEVAALRYRRTSLFTALTTSRGVGDAHRRRQRQRDRRVADAPRRSESRRGACPDSSRTSWCRCTGMK